VLFTATFALVQRLLAAKRDLRLEKELAILDGYDAVACDDLGYIQQDRDEMEVLFTFLAERYERRSVIITSNLVFSEWDRIFKDPMTTAAAIDRIVHHSVILEMTGTSIRIEHAQAERAIQGGSSPTTSAADTTKTTTTPASTTTTPATTIQEGTTPPNNTAVNANAAPTTIPGARKNRNRSTKEVDREM
jgi:IstB-like ATP binding protein